MLFRDFGITLRISKAITLGPWRFHHEIAEVCPPGLPMMPHLYPQHPAHFSLHFLYISLCLCFLVSLFQTCLYLFCSQTLGHMIAPKPQRRSGVYVLATFVVLLFLYLHHMLPAYTFSNRSRRPASTGRSTEGEASIDDVYNTTLGVSGLPQCLVCSQRD